jgi:hypothetical protein
MEAIQSAYQLQQVSTEITKPTVGGKEAPPEANRMMIATLPAIVEAKPMLAPLTGEEQAATLLPKLDEKKRTGWVALRTKPPRGLPPRSIKCINI